eukprot:CAMPEP_0178932714 /NCGR_PEP_ID=MMETSP0786-20121207/22794_1 /TAXON_ID=186022 /ORGANISM="Thalassionema frauenfeldii, Strain CCMP 1798" /LENGTH=149 /DNA_ID=CAMNT_0020610083 /DNA_START=59 /DNA_END=504 /DNA_ORIENTATION=+
MRLLSKHNPNVRFASFLCWIATISQVIAQPSAPFFAIFSDTVDGAGTERCGGVLIHPDILLTSVECAFAGAIARIGYQNDGESIEQIVIEQWVDHFDAWTVPGGTQLQENLPNDLTIVKLSIRLTNQVSIIQDGSSVHYAHAGNLEDIT